MKHLQPPFRPSVAPPFVTIFSVSQVPLRIVTVVVLLLLAVSTFLFLTPASATQPLDTSDRDFMIRNFPYELTDQRLIDQISFRDTWSARRPGGRRHKGTDVLAPKHAPVLALATGVVSDVGSGRLGGFFVEVLHPNGWSTRYLHLNNDPFGSDSGDAAPVWTFAPGMYPGAIVLAGQPIGYTGDSGNAENTTSLVHISLRHDGTSVNPYPYLVSAYRLNVFQATFLPDAPSPQLLPVPQQVYRSDPARESIELLSDMVAIEHASDR